MAEARDIMTANDLLQSDCFRSVLELARKGDSKVNVENVMHMVQRVAMTRVERSPFDRICPVPYFERHLEEAMSYIGGDLATGGTSHGADGAGAANESRLNTLGERMARAACLTDEQRVTQVQAHAAARREEDLTNEAKRLEAQRRKLEREERRLRQAPLVELLKTKGVLPAGFNSKKKLLTKQFLLKVVRDSPLKNHHWNQWLLENNQEPTTLQNAGIDLVCAYLADLGSHVESLRSAPAASTAMPTQTPPLLATAMPQETSAYLHQQAD